MRLLSVRLTVSRREVEHSAEVVDRPDLARLAAALSDLYNRLGCEASGREVLAEATDEAGTRRVYAEDPDTAPEEVAEELWARLVDAP